MKSQQEFLDSSVLSAHRLKDTELLGEISGGVFLYGTKSRKPARQFYVLRDTKSSFGNIKLIAHFRLWQNGALSCPTYQPDSEFDLSRSEIEQFISKFCQA